jgi:Protein of unknown function (DUF1622)
VFCDDARPGVACEVRSALEGVMPSSSVCTVPGTGCSEIKSYSTHWPCLFPQHGPGDKHTRPIVVLGLIVVIRTLLSFSLETEIEGVRRGDER